jgi:hypothetical protein
MAVLCAADGFCRHREYQRLKCALARRASIRACSPRSARRVASATRPLPPRANWATWRGRGRISAPWLRWWHLLPDGTTDNPLGSRPAFLRATFLPGRRRPHSRPDAQGLHDPALSRLPVRAPCPCCQNHDGRRFLQPQGPGLPPLPCVGCGWCCLDNPCAGSQQVYRYVPRCPALGWTGARYVCDLVAHPVAGVDLTPLFVGQGCCARHNAWRRDVRKRD